MHAHDRGMGPQRDESSPVRLLTVPQVVEATNASRSTVFRWLRAGLPAVRIGRTLRIDARDLEAFVNRHKIGA